MAGPSKSLKQGWLPCEKMFYIVALARRGAERMRELVQVGPMSHPTYTAAESLSR